MDDKPKGPLSSEDMGSFVDDNINIGSSYVDDVLRNVTTINVEDLIAATSGTFTISTLPSYNYTYTTGATGPAGAAIYGGSTLNSSWGSVNPSAGLHVSGTAEIEGDLKVKGVSILETLEKIERRLCILRPNPEKLEHFEALKKAYEHYKTLEALCEIEKEEKE